MAKTKNITIEELDDGFLVTFSEYANETYEYDVPTSYVAPKRAYAPTPQEAAAKIATFLAS